jgi:Predicted integral membrane protein (DUF2269)
MTSPGTLTGVRDGTRRRFGRRTRNAVLTVHIVVAVGLLGDSAGFLAVAIRREMSDDPAFVAAAHDLLGTFAVVFGIPLSFAALITGAALGLGTHWGLFRYPWVVIKLFLIVTVIAVGALVLRPVLDDEPTADGTALVVGSAYDVIALTAATALAVFKPGSARRRRQPSTVEDPTGVVAR